MPVIKVCCLPPDQSKKKLRQLRQEIIAAVTSVRQLGLNEKSVSVRFPGDLTSYGSDDPIIIEIGWLFHKEERTATVKQKLSWAVGSCVKKFYPGSKVECKVQSMYPKEEAFCVFPAAANLKGEKNVLMCLDKIHECEPGKGPECAGCGG